MITILIGITIFYFSSLTFETGSVGGGGDIKAILFHIIAFFFLGFFLLLSLVRGKYKKFFVVGILIAVLYGISDEIHQFFVPGRHMSLFDVFLDSLDISSGQFLDNSDSDFLQGTLSTGMEIVGSEDCFLLTSFDF